MRLLLDTHVLLWSLASPAKLPTVVRRQIDSAQVFVSAASIWEVSIKVGLGKLKANPAEILAALEPAGFELLPITGEHAARVATLPFIHKDPFDRLLVAQAICEPMFLLTRDESLEQYGDLVHVIPG